MEGDYTNKQKVSDKTECRKADAEAKKNKKQKKETEKRNDDEKR